jgi:hypothetical protein
VAWRGDALPGNVEELVNIVRGAFAEARQVGGDRTAKIAEEA